MQICECHWRTYEDVLYERAVSATDGVSAVYHRPPPTPPHPRSRTWLHNVFPFPKARFYKGRKQRVQTGLFLRSPTTLWGKSGSCCCDETTMFAGNLDSTVCNALSISEQPPAQLPRLYVFVYSPPFAVSAHLILSIPSQLLMVTVAMSKKRQDIRPSNFALVALAPFCYSPVFCSTCICFIVNAFFFLVWPWLKATIAVRWAHNDPVMK